MSEREVFNRNLAFNTNYKLEFPGLPDMNYFIQTVDLPGCNIGQIDNIFKNTTANVPGNRVDYDPLNATFLVSEDYRNYNVIRAWMHRLARGDKPLMEEFMDITLHTLSSNKTQNKRVVFYGSYPTNLSPLPFESGTSDPMGIVCTVTMKFQYFDFIAE